MSTGLPAALNGMNSECGIEIGGMAINQSRCRRRHPIAARPEPPAPVMMTTFSPFGVGNTGSRVVRASPAGYAHG
jgi:hypothetical protein